MPSGPVTPSSRSRSSSPSSSDGQAEVPLPLPSQASTSRTTPLNPDHGLTESTPARPRKPREFSLTNDNDAKARRHDRYAQQAFYTEGQSLGPVKMKELVEQLRVLMSSGSEGVTGAVMIQLAEGVSAAEFFKTVPQTSGGEKELYQAIKDSGLCARLVPMDSHATDFLDHSTGEQFRPDVILVTCDFGDDKKLENRTGLGRTVLVIEVKRRLQDPFGHVAGTKEARTDTEDRRDPRGQLGTYGELLFLNGHRIFVVSLVVMLPDAARLILYDRGAAVYSELFNWRKDGWLEKILALVDSEDASLGIDTSVKMIAQDSVEALRALDILGKSDLPDGIQARDVLPVVSKPDGSPGEVMFEKCEGDLSMMLIFDNYALKFHRIVVHRPFYCDTSGLTGPGTRHFYGIDLDEYILVHVQEDWRINLPDVLPEAHIYENFFHLRDASELQAECLMTEEGRGKPPLPDIPHLPDFLYGSDVASKTRQLHDEHGTNPIPKGVVDDLTYFETFSHSFAQTHPSVRRHKSDYCGQDDSAVEILPRRLCRLVFASIPLPLSKFKRTRQLAQALRDAIECHGKAYEYGILHRNVGAHSIFIDTRTGRGILMIWSQAREHLLSSGPRTKGRITNWYFMSARALENPDLTLELRDDQESFVHVLFYCALRYRPATTDDARQTIRKDLQYTFENDVVVHASGAHTGGSGKKKYLAYPEAHLGVKTLRLVSLPIGLKLIMQRGRALFRPLYVDEPTSLFDDILDDDPEVAAWRAAYDVAAARLVGSAGALLAAFDEGLNLTPYPVVTPAIDWPVADGAVDQYPPAASPDTPFHGRRIAVTAPAAVDTRKTVVKKRTNTQVSREPYSAGTGNITRPESSGNPSG